MNAKRLAILAGYILMGFHLWKGGIDFTRIEYYLVIVTLICVDVLSFNDGLEIGTRIRNRYDR